MSGRAAQDPAGSRPRDLPGVARSDRTAQPRHAHVVRRGQEDVRDVPRRSSRRRHLRVVVRGAAGRAAGAASTRSPTGSTCRRTSGHRGWVGVRLDRSPDWAEVSGIIEDAYRTVAGPRPPQVARRRCCAALQSVSTAWVCVTSATSLSFPSRSSVWTTMSCARRAAERDCRAPRRHARLERSWSTT